MNLGCLEDEARRTTGFEDFGADPQRVLENRERAGSNV